MIIILISFRAGALCSMRASEAVEKNFNTENHGARRGFCRFEILFDAGIVFLPYPAFTPMVEADLWMSAGKFSVSN